MVNGSCLCGDVKFEYQGEPAMKVRCHENVSRMYDQQLINSNRLPATAFLVARPLAPQTLTT